MKLDYGKDIIKYECNQGVLLVIYELFDKEEYSLQPINKNDLFRFVPNTGEHNLVTLNTTKKQLIFNYTSPDGKKRNEERLIRIKKGIKEKLGLK